MGGGVYAYTVLVTIAVSMSGLCMDLFSLSNIKP
jgi:hypothetical protein